MVELNTPILRRTPRLCMAWNTAVTAPPPAPEVPERPTPLPVEMPGPKGPIVPVTACPQ
jgi:hypothetical protein